MRLADHKCAIQRFCRINSIPEGLLLVLPLWAVVKHPRFYYHINELVIPVRSGRAACGN